MIFSTHIPRAETKAADLSGVSRSSESGTCKRFCSPVTLYIFHFFPTDFSKFEKRRIELLTKLSSMRRWSRKAVTSRFSSGEKFNQGSRVFIDCFLYDRTLEAGEYENKPRVISSLWANTGSTSILLHTLIFILKQQIIRSLSFFKMFRVLEYLSIAPEEVFPMHKKPQPLPIQRSGLPPRLQRPAPCKGRVAISSKPDICHNHYNRWL